MCILEIKTIHRERKRGGRERERGRIDILKKAPGIEEEARVKSGESFVLKATSHPTASLFKNSKYTIYILTNNNYDK